MSQHKVRDAESATLSRRTVIGALGAGIAVAGSGASLAQPVAPPTTITNPPRDFSRRGAPTTYFTDPDILTVDPVFDGIAQPNSAIQRLWTGALWSEGPAGVPSAATSSGAISRTIASCAGSRMTAASRCSAYRPTIRTATPSTSRAASCPASI